jgi:hypothetical protein
MRPENAPVLKGKSGKMFAQRLAQPLSPRQVKTYEEADRVFKAIKPREA